MPREKIQSYESDPDHELPALDVSWGRDYPDIEVMSHLDPVAARQSLEARLGDLAEQHPEVIAEVLDRLTEVHSGALGWCARLDRGGVNRLIRILRKARDQAFGADA